METTERLDELEFCSCHCLYHGEPGGCNRPEGECAAYRQYLELVQFEREMQSDNIVKLPCEIGDTVYFPDKENGIIDIGKIECFDIDSNNCKMAYARYQSGLTFWHTFEDFGKEVFLTENEAKNFLGRLL